MAPNRTFFQQLWQRKLVQWTAAYVTASAAVFGTLQTGEVFEWLAGLAVPGGAPCHYIPIDTILR